MNNWSSYGYSDALPPAEKLQAPARAEDELEFTART
jgi:hypothetical protein